MKILVAVDGSPISTKAVKFAINLVRQLSESPKLTLFYADPPLLSAVAIKLGHTAVKEYHDGNIQFATKTARTALNRAHVAFDEESVVAVPAIAIVRSAQKGKYDLIIMGSRGRSAFRGLLLGSVTSKVIANCEIPITIVR
ncbi:MAG: universal stress protein [Thermomonas sp.]